MILYLQESIFLVHDNRDIWCILVTLNIFLYYHRANKKHGMITRCQSRWQTFMCKAIVITFSLPSLHYHYPYVVGSSRFIMIIRALFKIIPIICFLCNLVMRLKAILGIIRCIKGNISQWKVCGSPNLCTMPSILKAILLLCKYGLYNQ